jgi:hypothetical protein
MTDLDTLGRRHRKLLAELDALQERLADAIRAERAAGATYADLMARSGYRSVEAIRLIVKPGARESANRRRRRGGDGDTSAPAG